MRIDALKFLRYRVSRAILLLVLLAPLAGANGQDRPSEPQPRQPGQVLPPPVIVPTPLPPPPGLLRREEPRPESLSTPLPQVPPDEASQEPVAPTQEAPTAPPPTVPAEVPPPPPSLPVVSPELLRREEITAESPLRPIPLGLAPPFEAPRGYGLQLFVTVQEEYTDNATQSKENPKSEFRTYISPGIAYRLERPQGTLNFNYTPTFIISANGVEDNRTNQFLSFRGTWSPGPYLRLGIADDFAYSTDFLAQGDLGARRTGTTPYLTNTGSFEANYVSPRGRLGLRYTNIFNQQNDVPLPDDSLTHIGRVDGELTGPSMTLGSSYWLTRGDFNISSPYWENNSEVRVRWPVLPILTGTFSGLFTYHDADRALSPDYITGKSRVGAAWSYGPTGSVEASAGVDVFSPQNPSTLVTEEAGTKTRPSVSVRWTHGFRLFTLSAAYDQGYQANFTSIDNTGLSFSRTAGASLTTTGALFRDLTATLGFNWVSNEFQQTTMQVREGTTDKTWNVEAGIRYYILRPLSLTLGYVLTLRDSTDPTAGFVENRVRIGLTYQHDLF